MDKHSVWGLLFVILKTNTNTVNLNLLGQFPSSRVCTGMSFMEIFVKEIV